MRTSADPRTRRKLIAMIVSGVILLALVAVGGYGLLSGTDSEMAPVHRDPAPSSTASPRPETPSRPQVPRILPATDPETFARRVAAALFTWDTAGAGLMPLDYTSAILDVGDPWGTEQAGLAADIATYLPSRDAWVQLRQYSTTQHVTIDNIAVPEAWSEAVAQARPGQLPPGAIAYTIDGVRHRDGIWNDEPQVLTEPVAFTMFFACPPDGDPCYLLRLSHIGSPLR